MKDLMTGVAIITFGAGILVGNAIKPHQGVTQADFTSCVVVREYEDLSVLMDCSGESLGQPEADIEPDPNLSFWEQLEILAWQGEHYA